MISTDTLLDDLIEDLTSELSVSDENFNSVLLTSKIKQAIREVKAERNYPEHYSDEIIQADLEKFYSTIRNIALYDYNQIGAEFQTSDTQSSNNRDWVDRNKLFSGVYPLAKI